jgi:hypothetical protein
MGNGFQSVALCGALILAGCATASVMDLDANTVQISAGAAPACGASGAQNFAVKTAAYQTLIRGFDKYIVAGAQSTAQPRFAGYTPMYANTYGNSTMITGGDPIVLTEHGQNLVVHMFHANDPGAENAIDAKTTLGPDWQKILAKGPGVTCTG